MNIADKIEQIKPKINYDYNEVVRATLYPFDQFVKKAVLESIDYIANRCRIIEKSVFVPLVSGLRYSDIVLSTVTKSQFNISQPKALTIFNSNNAVAEVSQAFLEELLSNKYTDLIKMGFFVQGTNYQIRASANIDNLTSLGVYDYITAIPSEQVVTLNGTYNSGDIDSYVINLEFADKGIYEYRHITGVSSHNLTLEGNSINTSWNTSSKVYVAEQLPLMLLFTFQGTPTPNYFTSETTIPIQEAFVQDLDNLIIKYLFQYLSVRDPKQLQVYDGLIKSGLVLTPDRTVTEIKKRINSNVTNPVTELYQPYLEYYGR